MYQMMMNISTVIAEDVGMPELRNPRTSGMTNMKKQGVIGRLSAWIKRRAAA